MSAALLRDELTALTNLRILVTQDADRIRGPFLRYGNSDPVSGPDTEYNSSAFINLVADKARFASLMAERKVYSPVYHNETLPNRFPVLIRTTLTGTNGRGIIVCPDKATFDAHWQASYVWTPFIKTEFELRIHVLGGKVVKVFKKLPTADTEVSLPIRNLDKGYHYQVRRMDAYPKMQALIDTIHPALDGRFYTLDVGWDKAKQKYLTFEANSGSGLNSETVKLYASYLAHEVNQSV